MPYSNPIVGGNTLIREAIQSKNYVTSLSGWIIRRDGTAEFADTIIRGTIRVVGPEGTIEILLDGLRPVINLWNGLHDNHAFINLIDDVGDPHKAALGVASGHFDSHNFAGEVMYGLLYHADSDSTSLAIRNAATQTIVGGALILGEQAGFFNAYTLNTVELARIQALATPANPGALFISASSTGTARDSALLVLGNGTGQKYLRVFNEGWNNVSAFSNGFGNIGAPYEVAGYRLDPQGRVNFRGSVSRGGALADGSLVFTLPAAYRPANDVVMAVGNQANNSALNPRMRVVASNGNVLISGFSSGGIGNAAFAMDGCSFALE